MILPRSAPPHAVLMACNAAFFRHASVCLHSLSEADPLGRFSVVLVATDRNADEHRKLLASVAKLPNIALEVRDFDRTVLEALPVGPQTYYPPDIYARFWVEDFFPPEVPRVLYLDADLLVCAPVAELYQRDLGGKILAAVSIPGSERPGVLGIPAEHGYFNSGVMMIDLPAWRRIAARQRLLDALQLLAPVLNDPDQDVLNVVFHADRLALPYRWNAITPFFRTPSELALPPEEIAAVTRSPAIVHFNGSSKPWQYLCRHPYKRQYKIFQARTEWRDVPDEGYGMLGIIKRLANGLLGERAVARLARRIRG